MDVCFSEWVGVFQTALAFLSTGFINDFRLGNKPNRRTNPLNDSKTVRKLYTEADTLL